MIIHPLFFVGTKITKIYSSSSEDYEIVGCSRLLPHICLLISACMFYESLACVLYSQFADAVGLNKRKYHIVGTSLGGFIVGIHAAMFPTNLASALLVCPAGIKSPIDSDMMKAYEREKKILLLPATDEEFIQMINLLVHKPVKFPKFIVSGIMQSRRQGHDFYLKSMFSIFTQSI